MTATLIAIIAGLAAAIGAWFHGRKTGAESTRAAADKTALKTAGELAAESAARAARNSERARKEREEIAAAEKARDEAQANQAPTAFDVEKARAELEQLKKDLDAEADR